MIGKHIDRYSAFLLYFSDHLLVICIFDVHQNDILIFFLVEFEDLLVDVHDGNVENGGMLGLDVVFGEEKFDETRGAYHLNYYLWL